MSKNRWRWIFIIYTVLFLMQVVDGYANEDEKTPQAIFLITFDAFRGDSYSFINPEEAPSTPNIDAFARDSIVFTNAYSPAPWTTASFSSFMTGISPLMYMQNPEVKLPTPLPKYFKTLAEYFQDYDYSTNAFVQHGWAGERFNFNQGFDYFIRHSGYSRRDQDLKRPKVLSDESLKGFAIENKMTQNLDQKFIESVESKKIILNKSFVWMHFIDPHQPYIPPKSFLDPKLKPDSMNNFFFGNRDDKSGVVQYSEEERLWIKHLYHGNIKAADQAFGNIIQYLKEKNIYENSLIVFSSDHGEEFWETGVWEHGHNHHPVQLHVPLIVKLPEENKVHKVISSDISTGSLFLTFLEQIGVDKKNIEFHELMAPSLASSFKKKSTKEVSYQAPIFFNAILHGAKKNQRVSIYQNRFLYSKYRDGREKFYFFNRSKKEEIKKFKKHKFYLYLKKELENRISRVVEIEKNIQLRSEKINYSENEVEELRTLGYLQ